MNRKERKDREGKSISLPQKNTWFSYHDEEADVLYLNFKRLGHADDSELMDNDVIVRFESEDIVGVKVMNASKKLPTLRLRKSSGGLHDLGSSGETSEAFKPLLNSLSLFSEDFMNDRI